MPDRGQERHLQLEPVPCARLDDLLDLAEVTVMGALTSEESRGAHARRDFPVRDDETWLKHTLAWHTPDGHPKLDYKPVTIDTWKPVERKYLRVEDSMLDNMGHPNRLGVWGWLGGGEVGPRAVLSYPAPTDGPRPAELLPSAHLRDVGAGLRVGRLGHVDGPRERAGVRGRRVPGRSVRSPSTRRTACVWCWSNSAGRSAIPSNRSTRTAPRCTSSVPLRSASWWSPGCRAGGRSGLLHPALRSGRCAINDSATWHVVAGLVILVFLGLHMTIMHLDAIVGIFNPADPHPIAWANVAARARMGFFTVQLHGAARRGAVPRALRPAQHPVRARAGAEREERAGRGADRGRRRVVRVRAWAAWAAGALARSL